ncbi:hypothetical protein SAY87_008800 [Trapa incisa]|uniref:Gnk2-homologous domain-containing protein n=1 Tax=Trapa incisa TaxID=236973 RepID=A0AAN7PWR7_9MYRT|nr:hypothetical protein SAY87_008800 [Trapa incisa]
MEDFVEVGQPPRKDLGRANECSPDLSATQCSDCLEDKIGNIAGCCNGKIGGRVIGPSCYIRFEVSRFYNASEQAAPTPSQVSSPPPPATNTTEPALEVNNSSNTTRIIIIVVVAASISLCIIIIGVFFFCRRKQRKSIQNNVEIEDEIRTAESLQYDFAIISAATDNFSEENKLGQGGFGYVYKVWRNWREGTVWNIIDPSLGSGQRSEIQRCIHTGLLCVQENAISRPTMASVVMMLNSFSISLPLPTAPAFYIHSNTRPSGISVAENSSGGNDPDESKSRSYQGSINEVSITDMYPR